ncbi:MAG TPA: aldo/keto reductase [bacterium]|nr:aldo/keto reductase [bacterium]
MQYRRLGWTDLKLSVIGFGSWALGGGGWRFSWGPQDDEDSIKAIRRAMELGVNWIDTAAVYGLGHSEEIVGKAIKDLSERPIIATKCGRVWDENGNIRGELSRKSLKRQVDDSLRRLQVDVIDLYQIHWPDPDEYIEEAWSTMADLVKDGKVRYIGVSNFSVEQMKRIEKIHPIASLQPPYSMLRREVESEILPYCKEKSIGVVVYSPMQKGLLTGKYNKETVKQLAPDDHRRTDPMFNEPQLSINVELVEKLKGLAEKYGRTTSQLAIAWILRRPEVTSAIVGIRRPSQIEDVAPAADWNLSEEDIRLIEVWLKEREEKIKNLGVII